MQPIVNIATRAARQAGDIIIRATERMDKLTIHNKADNDYVSEVDQMAEQVRRTCYSFVVYNRDFSNALCDAEGNTVAQGHQDFLIHLGECTAAALVQDL